MLLDFFELPPVPEFPNCRASAGSASWWPLIFALNRVVNLLAMDRKILLRFDAQSNFVTTNINNRDDHIVTDHDAFVTVSRERTSIFYSFYVISS